MRSPQAELFPQPKLRPSAQTVSGVTVGAPLAVVVLYWLDAYVLATPLPGYVAAAAGSLIAAAASYAHQLFDVLLAKVRD